MSTTNAINETRNGLTSPLIDVTSLPQVKSAWSTPRKFGWLIRSKILRFLFCVNDEMLEEVELECSVRDAIRDAMVAHKTGSGRQAVIDAMREVYDEQSYDIGSFAQAEQARLEAELEKAKADTPPYVARPVVRFLLLEGGEALQSNSGSSADESRQTATERQGALQQGVGSPDQPQEGAAENPAVVSEPVQRAMVVPKFAASVVLALRAKFGKLACHEANRLLIEREYLKLCRDTTVRNVDVELHRQWVINAYFNEGVTDQVATVRSRVPGWIRAAFGSVPNAAPAVF